MRFADMNPHVGQTFGLRVVDEASGEEVARVTIDAVAAPAFELRIEGLEVGGTYLVDFYADLNESLAYDAPPDDHAWRARVRDVQGDVFQEFAHGLFFTDIAWPAQTTAVEAQRWGVLKGNHRTVVSAEATGGGRW